MKTKVKTVPRTSFLTKNDSEMLDFDKSANNKKLIRPQISKKSPAFVSI